MSHKRLFNIMSHLEKRLWELGFILTIAAVAFGIVTVGHKISKGSDDAIAIYLAVMWLAASLRIWRRQRREIVVNAGFGVRAAITKLRASASWLFWWILRRRCTSNVLQGLAVHVESREQQSEILDRLAAALKLLEQLSPARSGRLARLQPALYIAEYPYPAGYMVGQNVIFLDTPWVLKTTAGIVSALIIHELNHAHTCSLGFGTSSPHVLSRAELVAIKETNRYASKLLRHGLRWEAAEVWKLSRKSYDRWFWRADGTRFRGDLHQPRAA